LPVLFVFYDVEILSKSCSFCGINDVILIQTFPQGDSGKEGRKTMTSWPADQTDSINNVSHPAIHGHHTTY